MEFRYLFLLLFFFGIASFSPEIGKVLDNSSASINDLREGDIITRINEREIKTFNDISRKLTTYGIKKRQIIHSSF